MFHESTPEKLAALPELSRIYPAAPHGSNIFKTIAFRPLRGLTAVVMIDDPF
jgi:hypothetical protein